MFNFAAICKNGGEILSPFLFIINKPVAPLSLLNSIITSTEVSIKKAINARYDWEYYALFVLWNGIWE